MSGNRRKHATSTDCLEKEKKRLIFLKKNIYIYIYIRVFKQVAIKWLPVTLWACVTNDALMAILKIKVNRDPATL
jgi:hypothetical protein